MKTILIIMAVLLTLLPGCYFAQTSPNCPERRMDTNPDLPADNPERTDMVNPLDWRLDVQTRGMPNFYADGAYFKVYNTSYPFQEILSPFEFPYNSNPSIPYSNYAFGLLSDYQPSQGWELFKFNFGYNMEKTLKELMTTEFCMWITLISFSTIGLREL